ncbi:MAG: MFS transporter, partial [Sciscionella sp.]|nr:MFS transporter [Sciscionella sp.]
MLAIPAFRRLLASSYFCSVGDWLTFLALSGLASTLMHGYFAQNFAFSGVVLTQLLPGLVFAPIGGVLADRFDRRKVMVLTDLARCGLFISIAVVNSVLWLFAANFLIGCMAMLWIPAKESSIPNLLRRKDQVETANQLGLVMTYGITVISGAGLYALITGVNSTFALWNSQLGIAHIIVIINGLLYLASATLIWTRIPEISGHGSDRRERMERTGVGFFTMLRAGARFTMTTPLIRGLVIGMVGAFMAGGAVVGAGRQYAQSLRGGESTFGLLFVALFVGLATGMASAPRFARRMTHNRLFGIAIVLAGLLLGCAAASPHLAFSLVFVALVGACAGIAFLTGVTIIGSQVEDALRGRVNALYQSLMKIILFGATIVVPLLVGLVQPRTVTVLHRPMIIDGTRPVLFGAGLVAALFGVIAYRQMGDRSTEPILPNLLSVIRGRVRRTSGLLVAVEGSTQDTEVQARLLAEWLRETGTNVVLAGDPALEKQRLQQVLSGASLFGVRAQALVSAAVRADVVERQVWPALDAGAVVVMQRFLDSSLAELGCAGSVDTTELEGLSDWATQQLRPDITVLLDRAPVYPRSSHGTVDGAMGSRADGRPIDARPIDARPIDARPIDARAIDTVEPHWRARHLLAEMAAADPDRYVVVGAEGSDDEVADRVRAAVRPILAGRAARVRELGSLSR